MAFDHCATLNLFREPDGHFEITVASGNVQIIGEAPDGLKPIDHIENCILAAAEEMKARKVADGTFRNLKGAGA